MDEDWVAGYELKITLGDDTTTNCQNWWSALTRTWEYKKGNIFAHFCKVFGNFINKEINEVVECNNCGVDNDDDTQDLGPTS